MSQPMIRCSDCLKLIAERSSVIRCPTCQEFEDRKFKSEEEEYENVVSYAEQIEQQLEYKQIENQVYAAYADALEALQNLTCIAAQAIARGESLQQFEPQIEKDILSIVNSLQENERN